MRKFLVVFALFVLPLSAARAQQCPGVAPWVFVDVAASHAFCTYVTWMAQNNVTLGCRIIDATNREYCPDDNVTRLQMAGFMSRLGNALFPLTCAAGQVMKWNGAAWTCANDNIGGSGGGGTVTSVLAGTGLTASPNPITGAGSINLAPGYQLPQSCANGQVAKSNGTGGWTCAADNDTNSGGTVTSVSTGTGLTGGTITTAGTIAVNTATIQARVTGTCAVGSSIRAIAVDGSVTCETDDAGPANAFVQGGNAFGATGVLGTADNQPLDIRVNGTRVARYEPNSTSPNIVAGHAANSAFAGVYGATIAGGGEPPGLSGEAPNRVTDVYGTVSGGLANQAGNGAGTTTDRGYATVGGGRNNTASGAESTVAGGLANTATEAGSAVGGGEHNHATSYWAVVGGGSVNTAAGQGATVGGGNANNAAGEFSTIGGGGSNQAIGIVGTVGGGHSNRASGDYSTVAGGYGNTASGAYSFAAGRRAKTQTADVIPTIHPGTFVFADQSDFDFNTAATNEFAVRATGGVRLVTAIDGGGAPTRTVAIDANGALGFGNVRRQMINLWAGADSHGIGIQNWTQYFRIDSPLATGGFAWYRGGTHSDVTFDPGPGGVTLMTLDRSGNLSTAGTVNGVSDVARKTAFLPADPGAILDRVVGLPITTWRYREDAAEVRHIGPTAQDFAAAFAVGADDKHIAMVDADGVALAAIKGLNAKVEAKLAEKDREIAELRALVERLIAAR